MTWRTHPMTLEMVLDRHQQEVGVGVGGGGWVGEGGVGSGWGGGGGVNEEDVTDRKQM